MKYRIFDKATKKEIDYSKYGITSYGDVICYKSQIVMLNSSDFEIMSEHEIKQDFNSKEYQVQLLQNFEREFILRAERLRTTNVFLVNKILTQFTSQGGLTSAYKHCDFLGIDPDRYIFY